MVVKENSENSLELVKKFFYEHPIHHFTFEQIAEYINLPKVVVLNALVELWNDEYISPSWVATDKILKECIKDE